MEFKVAAAIKPNTTKKLTSRKVRYADAISINLLWQQQIFFLRENRNKE
jgi:hypothetical protein